MVDVGDRHGFDSPSRFNNIIGSVLKTEWVLELSLKSSNHQARTVVTPSSFRTLGATTVPRISMASNIFCAEASLAGDMQGHALA
jgi:hypothetical protein